MTEESWKGNTLSATSELVGGDPYEVRIVMPKGMTAVEASLTGSPPEAAITLKQEGFHLRVTITAQQSGPARWEVGFRPE